MDKVLAVAKELGIEHLLGQSILMRYQVDKSKGLPVQGHW